MKDPEFIDLKNRFLLGVGICILLLVPFFFFMRNKLVDNKSTVISRINNNDSFIILVTDKSCKECEKYEKILKKEKIDFNKVNIDKDNNYPNLLQKLNLSSSEIIPPSIIYIANGHLFSTLVNIGNEEDINAFIKNFNLES